MTKTLQWETKAPTYRLAFGTKTFTTTYGAEKLRTVAVRLVKEAEGWKCDVADAFGGAWLPWEAAVPGAFPTLKEAKKAAREWAKQERVVHAA